jgi:outer membrane protein, multidrug efflux system
VSLLAEVARNYFELRGTQNRLVVARQNAENQRQTLDLTMALLEGGRGTELHTSRAEAQLTSTLATIPPLEAAVKRTMYRLGVLTGQVPIAAVSVRGGRFSGGPGCRTHIVGSPGSSC